LIDIKDLQAFVAIIDSGSLSHAAHELQLTQPAVSQKLKKMESNFGVKLFERTPRAMVPLEAARLIEPQMRDILLRFQILQDSLQTNVSQLEGTVRLGTVLGWFSVLVLPLIKLVHLKAPQLIFKVIVDQKERIFPMLMHGQLDMVVVPETFDRHLGLVCEPLLQETLVVVSTDSLPALPKDLASAQKELLSRPLVVMTLPDPLVDKLWKSLFDEELDWTQVKVPVQMDHIQNLPSVLELIPGSWGVLPKQTVWGWVAAKKLNILCEVKSSQQIVLQWKEGAMALKRFKFIKDLLLKEAAEITKYN
jgi:DNA-binding transcriptional LysR family regulator